MIVSFTILVSVIATFVTYYISLHLDKGPVFASAVVTLFSGILFSYIIPEWGVELGAVAACGSYGAMVSRDKFPQISDMIFVGLLCGVIFVLTEDVFVGVGGRLGSIAAIAGFSLLGFKAIKRKLIANK